MRPLLLSAWMFTVYGLGCEANFVTLTSCLVFVGLLQLDFATSPLIPPAPTAARDSQPTTPAPERRPRVAWVLWLLMLASTLLLIATYVIDEQEGELETDKVKRKRKAAADDD